MLAALLGDVHRVGRPQEHMSPCTECSWTTVQPLLTYPIAAVTMSVAFNTAALPLVGNAQGGRPHGEGAGPIIISAALAR
jgi:hypothetical protein